MNLNETMTGTESPAGAPTPGAFAGEESFPAFAASDSGQPQQPQQGQEGVATAAAHEGQSAPSAVQALLDGISQQPQQPQQAQPEQQTQTAQQPQQQEQQPQQQEQQPLEEAEAQALAEVKSQRGRERIQQVFAQRRQLEQDVRDFRDLVQSSGMNAQQFSQMLDYGRLVSSGNPENLRAALSVLDEQRKQICAVLGEEAQGVDLLQAYPDLASAVENLELTREHALEMVRLRTAGKEAQQKAAQLLQSQQMERQQQQAHQQEMEAIGQAQRQMQAALSARATQADHAQRMAALEAHFSQPANVQAFIATHPPQNWAQAVQWLYDNVSPQPVRAQPAPAPISARAGVLGDAAVVPGADSMQRMAYRMQQMGI